MMFNAFLILISLTKLHYMLTGKLFSFRAVSRFVCFFIQKRETVFKVIPEGKIIIFERFQCFLTKTIQLNCQVLKLIGKIEICSILANFCKTRPRLPSENEQKTAHFRDISNNIS